MRTFRSPNSGQTSLTLQHSTSPASGYRPPAGHNADGYTNGGDRVSFAKGGKVKKNWIQSVNKSIKKRGTKGKCTPITKKGCTGRAKALAKTFKKMAKKRKGK